MARMCAVLGMFDRGGLTYTMCLHAICAVWLPALAWRHMRCFKGAKAGTPKGSWGLLLPVQHHEGSAACLNKRLLWCVASKQPGLAMFTDFLHVR